MPLVFDHSVPPPEGHHFVDPSGLTITAGSLRILLGSIASYRAQNGQPPGNPEAEVERYYKTKYPWLITKVGTTPAVIEDPVARWINRAWKSPVKDWAETETVNARLATCLPCEYYDPDRQFGADATRRIVVMGAGRLRTAGACRVHHWPIGLAILAQERPVASSVEGCWAGSSPSP